MDNVVEYDINKVGEDKSLVSDVYEIASVFAEFIAQADKAEEREE